MAITGNYIKVIRIIDEEWPHGEAFAIWELRDASGVSTSSVTRILRTLTKLRYITRNDKGYLGRHYRVTALWNGAVSVVESFELARTLGI